MGTDRRVGIPGRVREFIGDQLICRRVNFGGAFAVYRWPASAPRPYVKSAGGAARVRSRERSAIVLSVETSKYSLKNIFCFFKTA